MLDTEIELHPPPAPFATSFLLYLLTKKTRDFCSMVNFALEPPFWLLELFFVPGLSIVRSLPTKILPT